MELKFHGGKQEILAMSKAVSEIPNGAILRIRRLLLEIGKHSALRACRRYLGWPVIFRRGFPLLAGFTQDREKFSFDVPRLDLTWAVEMVKACGKCEEKAVVFSSHFSASRHDDDGRSVYKQALQIWEQGIDSRDCSPPLSPQWPQ